MFCVLPLKGPVDCAIKTVREDGALGLWAGAAPTVLRNGTNQMCLFWAKNHMDGVLWGEDRFKPVSACPATMTYHCTSDGCHRPNDCMYLMICYAAISVRMVTVRREDRGRWPAAHAAAVHGQRLLSSVPRPSRHWSLRCRKGVQLPIHAGQPGLHSWMHAVPSTEACRGVTAV
jgi:Mitochondrial carrier protein